MMRNLCSSLVGTARDVAPKARGRQERVPAVAAATQLRTPQPPNRAGVHPGALAHAPCAWTVISRRTGPRMRARQTPMRAETKLGREY